MQISQTSSNIFHITLERKLATHNYIVFVFSWQFGVHKDLCMHLNGIICKFTCTGILTFPSSGQCLDKRYTDSVLHLYNDITIYILCFA